MIVEIGQKTALYALVITVTGIWLFTIANLYCLLVALSDAIK